MTVSGSNFTDNKVSATGMGGAIFCEPSSKNNITGSTFTNNVDIYPSAIMSYQGTLDLTGNTFNGPSVFNYAGTITSEIKAIVLNNETAYDDTVTLTAKITDDNDNVIRDSTFQFVINGEPVTASYNTVTKLYQATYTLPALGVYPVTITSTTNNDLTIKTGAIKNVKGTFTALNYLIKDATEVNLTGNFTYDEVTDGDAFVDGIVIDHALTINGNGYTINGNNVARIFNVTAATTLNNVTFVNGSADKGGAIYNGADLTVVDSVFEDNKAAGCSYAVSRVDCTGGAAIYAAPGSSLNVTGTTFKSNSAPHASEVFSAGGAIYVNDANLLVSDSTFEDNSAVYGGAIMFENFNQDTVAIKDSVFNNNTAWQGGAINGNDFVGSLIITGSNFTGNKATTPNAGQSSPTGGAIMIGSKSYTGVALDVAGCNFVENDGGYMGGAIASSPDNTIKVADSNFTGNVASTLGGAIVTGTGTDLTVSGSNFTDNKVSATGMGGAIFCEPNSKNNITGSTFTNNVDIYPSAIMSYQGTLDLTGNTFNGPSVFNYAGTITSKVYAVVLSNKTVTTSDNKYTLNATLTDDNGNFIRDSTLRFVVNGVTVATQPTYINGLYVLSDYPITTDYSIYLINVTSSTDDEIIVKTGTIENLLVGTFTDLQAKIDDAIENNSGVLDLTYNFTYNADIDGAALKDGIVISQEITIDGNGTTISGANLARIFNITAKATLKNVTFVNGSADKGGAIYNGADLTVVDSVFEDNKAAGCSYAVSRVDCTGGAAIYAAPGSSLNVTGTTFKSNSAPHASEVFSAGGAIYVNDANLLVSDSTFEDNSAVYGGAIMFENFNQDTVAIKDSVFNNNTAWQGGAINGIDFVGSLIITGSNFTGNKATTPNAGQSSPTGGAIMIGSKSYTGVALDVAGCNFVENDGGYMGGAIASSPDNTIKVADSNFTGNVASTLGGAIVTGTGTDLTVSGSNFTDNKVSATGMGGAIFCEPNSKNNITGSTFTNNVDRYPSAIMSYQGTLDLTGNTFNGPSVFNYAGTITSKVFITLIGGQNITAALGEVVTPNATLTDDNGNIIRDSTLKITVGGQELPTSYADGLYTATYTIETAGDKVVSTSYDGATVTEGKYIVPKANVTEFTVAVEDIIDDENATVLVTLTGVNGIGLNDTVTVILNNTEYTIAVTDGKGNKTIEGLAHGQYPVVAMLNESANYNNAINSTIFYVKATTTLTIAGPEEDVVYGEPVTVTVHLEDSEGNGLTGIVILSSGDEILVKDGEGSITLETLDKGEYTFTAVFEGDNDYNASESNAITLNVTAKDIEDENVSVYIYGKAPDNVTVSIEGPEGTYNVTVDGQTVQVDVKYDEDAGYAYGSTEIAGLTAGDKEATIAIDDDNYEGTITETFTYKYVPEFTVEIIGTYPTAEITIEGTDGTYVVYIDEEHQTEITVKEGTGSGNISGVAAGVYEYENEAHVYFVETEDYQYASTYVPFEIAKATPVIKVEADEATYPADVVVTVTSDVAGTYTVTVGDKSEEVTLEANVAKDVTFEGLDANEEGYAIEVTYEETENYNAAVNNTETVKVLKAAVVFDATVATPVAYPNDVIVTVNTTVAGKVTVKLDKDYVFDVAAGVTDLTIPGLAVGTYSSKIVQFDADNYAAAEDEITFEVTKGTPAFDVDVVVGKDTYPGSVVVIVTSDVDGTFNVAVGTQIAPVTVSKGVGYTTFNNVASGKQNATVTFVEDASYKETSLDKEFTINQAAPEFTVEVAEATYPDPVQVSIKGTDGTYHILGTTITVTGGVGSGSVEGLAAGTYTDVKVTFDAAGDYAAGETTVSFTVKQKASEVTVTPVTETVTYPGEVNITYSASEEAITITVTDANGNDVAFTPADGKIALTNLAAGTYTVTVAIADSQNITGSSDSTTFTVGQAASSVVITPVTETITYPGAVNVTVTAVNGVADITVTDASGATVDFTIDNDKVVLTNLAAGTYTVSAAIAGTENITGSSDSITFTVAKAAMTPTVSVPEKAEIGENFTVIAEDYYGDVTVEINGVNYALNENISLAEGTYNVKVIFAGNENYTGITVEKTINVTKKSAGENPLNITVPENTTTPTFSIELLEDATGYLLVDVDGEQYYAPLVNGKASITTAPLAGGNHTVKVTYTGDDKYAGFSNTTNMTIDSNVTADTALDVPASSENTPTFSVNLPSDATGFLTVDVDGKKYAAVVENGKASISVPGLSEGNHNVTVIYSGDAKYPTLTKDATVNVHIPVYKITQNKNINVVYSAKATYKVLITKDGKAVGAGESVTIKYNGKTYTVKTDSKGYATFKPTTKVKVKKYTITATYNGVTVKNTVNVKHLIKASNKKIKKSKKVNKIKVKTNKVNGKYLKGKKLTLKIKGKKVKAKINKKGVATFKLKKSITKKLKAGKKYKYTVTYGKDKVTKKVKVKR